jgi:GR25 family glycosyltransferase involved in LPS biosynthesis
MKSTANDVTEGVSKLLQIYTISKHRLHLDPLPAHAQLNIVPPFVFDPENPFHNQRVSEQRFFAYHGRQPLRGEIGCALAHAEIYRAFTRTQSQWALVLEDDALIHDPSLLHSRCAELMETLNDEESIVVSFCHPKYPQGFFERDGGVLGLVIANAPPAQTVAYLLTRKAAEILMQATDVVHRVADWPVEDPQVKFLLDLKCPVGEGNPAVRAGSTIDIQGHERIAPSKIFDFQVWTAIWWFRFRHEFGGWRNYWRAMVRPRFMLRWHPISRLRR